MEEITARQSRYRARFLVMAGCFRAVARVLAPVVPRKGLGVGERIIDF
ncbi:hypothetical protein [Nostoc sp.]